MQKEQKKHKFEFRVLCSSDEACKRVRFGMETGIYLPEMARGEKPRQLTGISKTLLGTPAYLDLIMTKRKPDEKPKSFLKCDHEVPYAIHLEARKDVTTSLEVPCMGCDTTLTIIPHEMELQIKNPPGSKKEFTTGKFQVFATVDFVHYDDYPKNKRKVAISIEDHGKLNGIAYNIAQA